MIGSRKSAPRGVPGKSQDGMIFPFLDANSAHLHLDSVHVCMAFMTAFTFIGVPLTAGKPQP
jgi:hypothetical protein